ncbi:protein GrpE-like [Phoenix dactylifera]|uniref:Protein GrpE-like n=1 Tax=Phoenix dactylifera TaxID=42345 RepID=A0A8B9AG04_PHODC|nr:protein GrpE-like [Phoenix dactylifera]
MESSQSKAVFRVQVYKIPPDLNDYTRLRSSRSMASSLATKDATLSEEDHILRIIVDFDNFRKRTEKEGLSLMTKAQGQVIESLLPVLDNFERDKTQIKVETGRRKKVHNSYQSTYKQFLEILSSLGVEGVESVGNPFDPLESMEFEEGIIIQEFRKGFELSERLLHPSMVKVSAGPGPAKPDNGGSPADEDNGEASQESTKQGGDSD